MNIVTQSSRADGALPLLLSLSLAIGALPASGQAREDQGQIVCKITRNGGSARGTVALEKDGRELAHGACSGTLEVPAGLYRAVVRLDGNLDHPQKTLSVRVEAGQRVPVEADFRTGGLIVRVLARAGAGPALIAVYRGKQRIGTLNDGVEAQLSEGRYEIVVEQSGQKKTQTVDLRAGQTRMVRVEI